MGSILSSEDYDKDKHGVSDRAMFDRYIADDGLLQDLSGKVVAITGTSVGGMGYCLGEAAIRKKAKVLLCLNRDSASAKQGQEGLEKLVKDTESPTVVQAVTCDLQSLDSVKTAATNVNKVAKQHDGLDVLILNAGIMATRDKRTSDGFDIQMQTNQLSHFLLTSIVFESVKLAGDKRGDARIVTHSSSARDTPGSPLIKDFFVKSEPKTLGGDDTWMVSELLFGSWGPWQRYHQTKLANSAFAMALHEKLAAKGLTTSKVKALTSDPGLAASNLQVSSTRGDGLMSSGMAKFLLPNGQSAEDGSLSCAMCAFSPQANSGDMYAPKSSAKGEPVKTIEGNVPVKKGGEKLTCNKENQENVWKWCEEALGITFEV